MKMKPILILLSSSFVTRKGGKLDCLVSFRTKGFHFPSLSSSDSFVSLPLSYVFLEGRREREKERFGKKEEGILDNLE